MISFYLTSQLTTHFLLFFKFHIICCYAETDLRNLYAGQEATVRAVDMEQQTGSK